MAPKRTGTVITGAKPKIQKTLSFKSVISSVTLETLEYSEDIPEPNEEVPKGKDGKVDYKSMTNLLPKDFVEKSAHNVFIGAHLSIAGM